MLLRSNIGNNKCTMVDNYIYVFVVIRASFPAMIYRLLM